MNLNAKAWLASALITVCLMTRESALLERRMSGGSDGGETTSSEVHYALYVNRLHFLSCRDSTAASGRAG
jgi:hypothetical protein